MHFGRHGAVRLAPVSGAPVLDIYETGGRVCLRAPHAPEGVDLTPYRQELEREELGLPPPYSQVEVEMSPSDESPNDASPNDEDKDNEDEEAGAQGSPKDFPPATCHASPRNEPSCS